MLPLFSSKCKKERIKKPGEIVYLREASLSEIKNEITGNWKIHYSYGGLTGNIKSPMPNSFFKIKPNDSVFLTLNGALIAEDKAVFIKSSTTFGYTATRIEFSSFGGSPFAWIVDHKLSDTLILVDDHVNSNAYSLTRIPL